METDEPLETGYGPAAPVGDNLCNDYARFLAGGYRELGLARGDRITEDAEFAMLLADRGSPSLFGNAVVTCRPLSGAEWAAAARRMHAFYGERPGGDFLVFSPWPTPDLKGFDFGRVGHPPVMYRPPSTLVMPEVKGLEIHEVSDAAGGRDFEKTLIEGFPEPSLQPYAPGCLLPEAAFSSDRWRHWVGYLDGQPVATAAAYVAPTAVLVDSVATQESARRRGLGAALTAIATLADPALPAMLITSDLGRSLYERLGYRALLRFTLWAGHRRQELRRR